MNESFRVGALTDPRPEDQVFDSWQSAMAAGYEKSQTANPWDRSVFGIWASDDSLVGIAFEGRIFTD